MGTGFGVYGLHEQQNWNSEEFVGIDNKGRQLVKDKDNGDWITLSTYFSMKSAERRGST